MLDLDYIIIIPNIKRKEKASLTKRRKILTHRNNKFGYNEMIKARSDSRIGLIL